MAAEGDSNGVRDIERATEGAEGAEGIGETEETAETGREEQKK